VFSFTSAAERFIYLFIRHDDMQPGGYGLLEKHIKCLERERTNNPKIMPCCPANKRKMQKWNVALQFPVQQGQKATPSSTMPFPPLAAMGPRGRVPLS